jgi:hypothetical protein
MGRRTVVIAVVAAALLAVWAWRTWWPSDEQRIRGRLRAFAADFNESTTDGLGTVARAARLGSYLTDDVVVDLGSGSPPIQGRETLMAMATRLQMRTAAFTLDLVDINVTMAGGEADVNLTVAFKRRSIGTGEESVDAREMALRMVKSDGEWRIRRASTVETFR